MDIENKKRFEYLFDQYFSKTASPAELLEFYRMMRNLANDEEIADCLEQAFIKFEPSDIDPSNFQEEKVFKNVLAKVGRQTKLKKTRQVYNIYGFLAAAIVLVVLSVGIYVHRINKLASNVQKVTRNQILPGSNKAILTLSDGSKIALDDKQTGILVKDGQVVIRKSENGQINYLDANNGAIKNGQQKAVAYNTISTPRGGQYRVVLPDGTKVWLNSSSSLKYPSYFSDVERIVQLNGEGYFEVAKNEAIPFHVKIEDVDVQVLGTHFNIMGYQDETFIKTSLLEGAVRIAKGGSRSMLKPGQQAIISNKADEIKIKTVDLEDAVAWKNGYFMFDNEDLGSVMRKLSRWYDVEIVYNGNFKHVAFSGTVSRFEHISEVLKTLELTEMVHFKIEGRRIIVME